MLTNYFSESRSAARDLWRTLVLGVGTEGHRDDVDGLRSIAVLTVILFHFGISALGGGFIGVDVFFVISGYVITKTITRDLEQDRFSFIRFYARRAKRIFPALFVMMIATGIAGYFILAPGDYKNLGESGLYSAFFLGNFYFFWSTGYFDAEADTMAFLHTWSLAVEEQFYIFWPLILTVLWVCLGKFRTKLLFPLLALVTSVGYAYCIWVTTIDQKFAYFMLPARFWQLSAGAALVFMPEIRWSSMRHFMSVTGAALIACACLHLNEDNYPGYWAGFPTFGAALLIAAGRNAVVNRVLATGPFVFVGKISYAAYLWHWPIVTLYGHYKGNWRFDAVEVVIMIALTMALSILSYTLLEQPVRKLRISDTRAFVYGLVGCLMIAMPFSNLAALDGIPLRVPASVAAVTDIDAMWDWECRDTISIGRSSCAFGADWKTAKYHAVLWGDSHSQHFAPLFDQAGREAGVAFILWPNCPIYIDDKDIRRRQPNTPNYNKQCVERTREARKAFLASRELDLMVFASAWSGLQKELFSGESLSNASNTRALDMLESVLARELAKFAVDGKKVLVVSDVPRPNYDVPACLLQNEGGLLRKPCARNTTALPLRNVLRFQQDMNTTLENAVTKVPGAFFINSVDRLCDEKRCPMVLNSELIYRDTNHLRRDLKPETLHAIEDRLGLARSLKAIFDGKTPTANTAFK